MAEVSMKEKRTRVQTLDCHLECTFYVSNM